MAKKTILKGLVKKAKKPSGIKKSTPRYIKTASGMKLNPERFKQKPQPKTKRLVTLSPLTPMATHFHISNGAKQISINNDTQNFEYKL